MEVGGECVLCGAVCRSSADMAMWSRVMVVKWRWWVGAGVLWAVRVGKSILRIRCAPLSTVTLTHALLSLYATCAGLVDGGPPDITARISQHACPILRPTCRAQLTRLVRPPHLSFAVCIPT